MTGYRIIQIGAINGFLTVAFGAFGAHGLKSMISPQMLSVFQTAVQYHGLHALALIGVGLMIRQTDNKTARFAAYAFLLGTLLFCGSLYLMAVTGIRWLGAITPIGGLSFLVAWALFALAAGKMPQQTT